MKDKESGNLRLPHRLDEKTGMYRGKQIVSKKEIKKEEKKDKEKAKKEHDKVEAANTNMTPEKHTVTEERESKKGLIGRMTLGKAKSRSGFGGGV